MRLFAGHRVVVTLLKYLPFRLLVPELLSCALVLRVHHFSCLSVSHPLIHDDLQAISIDCEAVKAHRPRDYKRARPLAPKQYHEFPQMKELNKCNHSKNSL